MLDRFTLRDVYGRWLRTRRPRALAPSTATSLPLPFDRLERLVTRRGSESDRLRALDVLMSTAEGRQEFELMWAAVRAVRTPRPRARMHSWLVAAALIFAVGLGVTRERAVSVLAQQEALRGGASPLQLVSPRGSTGNAHVDRFEWRRVQAATQYTMVIVDRHGKEVFASRTTETEVKLPSSIHLDAGGTYLWWVQAELADGTQVSAVTETITVTE